MPVVNDKYGKFFTVALLTLFIFVAGIIWASSKIDTKADQAFNFVAKNYDLPIKVQSNITNITENKIKIERFQESVNLIIKVQSKQEDLLKRLETLTIDLKELEKEIRRRE